MACPLLYYGDHNQYYS